MFVLKGSACWESSTYEPDTVSVIKHFRAEAPTLNAHAGLEV